MSLYNQSHQIKWFSLKFASNIIRLSTMCFSNNSIFRVNAGENLLALPIASLQRISTTLDQMCSCSTDENRCTFHTLTSCMTINKKLLQCIEALDKLQLSRKKRDASYLVSKNRMPKYLVSFSTKITPILTHFKVWTFRQIFKNVVFKWKIDQTSLKSQYCKNIIHTIRFEINNKHVNFR